ncbi:hypothetical protein [Actinoplanes regularis]|uniref:hypothetical protein n=1 Tax=Actinoplanes regularis TaxID=52697 RepID=UPI0025561412|nr:hypothetical protein [Actinoplanes regularis]
MHAEDHAQYRRKSLAVIGRLDRQDHSRLPEMLMPEVGIVPRDSRRPGALEAAVMTALRVADAPTTTSQVREHKKGSAILIECFGKKIRRHLAQHF